jgi:NADPH2:quinone reductase
MKGITVDRYGDSKVLKFQDIDLPELKPTEVKVKIHAAGINFVDIYQRRGDYQIPPPFTLGLEAAGVVEAVGEGVDSVKVGDRIAYVGQQGAYAQFSNVPANLLILLPDELSFEQGAAFPLQGLTTQIIIDEFKTIRSGDRVLIHAAAGGMGLLLVQWAKHLGADVIGTVSTEAKAKLAMDAGCDRVILYTQQNTVEEIQKITQGKGVDLIIDGVGQTTMPSNLEIAALRGYIISYGWAGGVPEPVSPMALIQRSLTLASVNLVHYLEDPKELRQRADRVLEGVQEGWLKLQIGQVFSLEEAAKAHELLESRSSTGKIILKVI